VVAKKGFITLFYLMKQGDAKTQPDQSDFTKIQMLNLGKRIKSLRIKMGYSSYEQFAYENEMSRSQYGRYENGQDLRLTTLLRLVEIFGLSLSDFFNEGFD
jgi:DNA-binding XRE family transcriptional regulator